MYSWNATKDMNDEQFMQFHVAEMQKRTDGESKPCIKCDSPVSPDDMIYFLGGVYDWVCLNKLYFSLRPTALRDELEGKPELEDYKNYIERALYVFGCRLEESIKSFRQSRKKQ